VNVARPYMCGNLGGLKKMVCIIIWLGFDRI
jgi:hypothetical protein